MSAHRDISGSHMWHINPWKCDTSVQGKTKKDNNAKSSALDMPIEF